MKSLKFKSPKSTLVASFIDSFNTKLKASNKSIERYHIHVSAEGRTSAIIYYN